MKNKIVKLFILGSVITSFLFVLFFGFNVNAEENAEPQEETTQEVVEPTQEEVKEEVKEEEEKINAIVDFLSKLNKDELMNIITTLKNWLIAIGVVGTISLLTAIIGLIAALTKLKNEKIRNQQLTKEEQDKRIEDNNNTQKTIVKEADSVKLLLLDFMNGLSDKDKEQVSSNIANVKARLLELNKDNNEE